MISLNQLAATTSQPAKRGKIALLIGECQSSGSRFTEAAAAFSRAGAYGRQAQKMDIIFAAGLGEIRALLSGLRTADAKTAASALLAELDAAQQQIQELLNLSPQVVAEQGGVVVPPRPPRSTVGLTRIANAFQAAGLIPEAKSFLEKAVILSPNGASRARQSLARIALASDDPARAESLARDALQMGRFQVKTIAAWPLYLDARARQNISPILDPLLYQSFISNTTGRVRACSLLSIIRILRGHGDPYWKSLAEEFLASSRSLDAIVATEIEKIVHADAKLTNSDSKANLAARSLRLFRDRKASPNEQVASTKSYVRYCLESGSQPDLTGLIRIAGNRFTPAHVVAVRHAAALGAMDAQQHDIARTWLMQLRSELPGADPAWGRSTWALARMEALLDRNSDAAAGYLEVAANPDVPARFRIQAMLRGLKHLTKAGSTNVDIVAVSSSIRSILASTSDYAVVLDAARQLSLAGSAFVGIKREAAERGILLADQAINSSTSAREAFGILEFLSRKLYWDIGNYSAVLSRWDSLDEKRRMEFRSAGGSNWYHYLAVIFRSLIDTNRHKEAVALASSVIDGDQSTSEGYVITGSEYAAWLIIQNQIQKAFDYFEWIATEAPTHRSAAIAHYWLAIKSLKIADLDRARKAARAIRACYSGCPSLLSEWEFDARAIIIIEELSKAQAASPYPEDFIDRQVLAIKRDISLL